MKSGSLLRIKGFTLQKLQNRAARIVTKSSFDTPSIGLIQSLNWPTVSDIIRSETATTVYKSLNGLVPEYLSSLFEKKSTRNVRELRNTETDLSIPLRKTNNGQRAISFRGPKLWNSLELDIKQAPTLATFKRRIKSLQSENVYATAPWKAVLMDWRGTMPE